ncbi:MAG TPA: outer membrane protein transport protein [Thermoanaerobaculia bacterium]
MTHRPRVALPRVFLALVVCGWLLAAPATPSGFQVMTQGARATGMGLAFTGVADDPSAIFYNPAGMGFQEHFSIMIGGSVLGRKKADFEGADPFPGDGTSGSVQKQEFVIPELYAVVPLTSELNFGLGVNSPYGLGLRWNDPEHWVGRFISQNAVIKSLDVNPVFSYKLFPELSIAAGADLRFSKVQLEQNTNLGIVDPFGGQVRDLAHVKLNSSLTSNTGWGWNVGLLFKPIPDIGVGVAYRSKINVDFDGTAVFTQRFTGNPAIDNLVAAQLPQGEHPVETSIEFPASLNMGVGIELPAGFLLALEADWTEWSSFSALNIHFPDGVAPDKDRATLWKDSWAYRVGLEKKFASGWAVRGGYYYDNTPQPEKDVGPILADNDRNVYSAGFGYNTPQWGIDVGGLYIRFKDRNVLTESTDNFFGHYSEDAWVGTASFRFSF